MLELFTKLIKTAIKYLTIFVICILIPWTWIFFPLALVIWQSFSWIPKKLKVFIILSLCFLIPATKKCLWLLISCLWMFTKFQAKSAWQWIEENYLCIHIEDFYGYCPSKDVDDTAFEKMILFFEYYCTKTNVGILFAALLSCVILACYHCCNCKSDASYSPENLIFERNNKNKKTHIRFHRRRMPYQLKRVNTSNGKQVQKSRFTEFAEHTQFNDSPDKHFQNSRFTQSAENIQFNNTSTKQSRFSHSAEHKRFNASNDKQVHNSRFTQTAVVPLTGYVRPIRHTYYENALIKELSNDIIDKRKQADFKSNRILAEHAYFLDFKKLILRIDKIVSHRIKKNQTKVKLSSVRNSVICRIVDHGLDHGFPTLKLRLCLNSHFLPDRNDMETFKVSLYPNYQEIEFAEMGYNAIRRNEAMLKKLWAWDYENPNRPSLYCSDISDLYDTINIAATTPLNPIIICAKTNDDIENFATNLKNEMFWLFQEHSVVRVVTMLHSNLSSELFQYTKLLHNISNFRSYRIVFCTIGVVPKLIENETHRLNNNYFKEIFIVESQKAKELDCWMAIGHAANVNTKIYISGTKHREQQHPYNSFYRENDAVKDNSMFDRLCKKQAQISNLPNNSEFFVFKL